MGLSHDRVSIKEASNKVLNDRSFLVRMKQCVQSAVFRPHFTRKTSELSFVEILVESFFELERKARCTSL